MHVHFEITYLQPKIVVDNCVHKYILFQSLPFPPHFVSSIILVSLLLVLTVVSFIFLKHKPLPFSTFPLCVTFIRTFILTYVYTYNLFITKKCRTRRTSSFVHVPGCYFSFVTYVGNSKWCEKWYFKFSKSLPTCTYQASDFPPSVKEQQGSFLRFKQIWEKCTELYSGTLLLYGRVLITNVWTI